MKGRVQGVGFRWFVRETAEALGLSGWVRNRDDGSVEAEAEGPQEALERLAAAMQAGCPGSRVEGIQTRTVAAKGDKSFEIRR